MSLRLADRLREVRRQRFVGRSAETQFFRSVLALKTLPFHVLYVFGPAGIGKTTLLGEFAHICEALGICPIRLDLRAIQSEPDSFLKLLRSALRIPSAQDPIQYLSTVSSRQLMLIDSYQSAPATDAWLRESLLPQLPEDTLVVLAGRDLLPVTWRVESGWQGLIRYLRLPHLSREECRAYLNIREVPAEQHETILEFASGHPFALALIADLFAQRQNFRFEPDAAPDMVKTLLEALVQEVPTHVHRAALEACGLVTLTTEGLLVQMLQIDDAREVFDWLRSLSFIESRHHGIYPHDLAREALATDLRWRNPDWYRELQQRARLYYTSQLQRTSGLEQETLLGAFLYLFRDHPTMRRFIQWKNRLTIAVDPVQAGDIPDVLDMVERHEGTASARIAQYWLGRQPQGMFLLRSRDTSDRLAPPKKGFLAAIALDQVDANDRATDPATEAVMRYVERNGSLLPSESATFFRYWMSSDSYQSVSPMQSRVFLYILWHCLSKSQLAYTFIPCADSLFWSRWFENEGFPRVPDADFRLGRVDYGVFAHDWRVVTPSQWLSGLLDRNPNRHIMQAAEPPEAAGQRSALDEATFTDGVRAALRDLHCPDLLLSNPLLQCRLVCDRAGMNAGHPVRIKALQTLVREACQSLQDSPRRAKLHRALLLTYLEPAGSQQQAADALDLPFGTYRDHLKAGIGLVRKLMWQRELGVQLTEWETQH